MNEPLGIFLSIIQRNRIFLHVPSLHSFSYLRHLCHVSQQKCGFHGYREFIYEYKQILKPDEEETVSDFDIQEFNTYQELLNKSSALLDNSQITRIVNLLVSMPRVYVYGRGSSGLVAQEMQLRFMRIG